MRFKRCEIKAHKRVITERRLKIAQKKRIKKIQDCPLFPDWMESILEPVESRLERIDNSFVDWCQEFRLSASQNWRKGRSFVRNHPQKDLILFEWNNLKCPAEASYFLGFLRKFGYEEDVIGGLLAKDQAKKRLALKNINKHGG